MNKRRHAPARIALAIAAVLALPTPSTAQVKVIISGGFSAAYRQLLQYRAPDGLDALYH